MATGQTAAAQASPASQETEETRTLRMWSETRRRIKIGPDGMIFENYDDLWMWAILNQNSVFIPKDFRGKPGEIAIAVQFGQTVGLSAVQALQDVMVVHGRPSMYGNALLAVVRRSGRFDEAQYDLGFEGTPYEDGFTAWCTMARLGSRHPKRFEYSVADAKRAKLWENKDRPTWCKHPKDMLTRRCHGFGMKYLFPDVLKGLYDRDEMLDVDATLAKLDLTGSVTFPIPKPGQTQDDALTDALSKPPPGSDFSKVPQPDEAPLPGRTTESVEPQTARADGTIGRDSELYKTIADLFTKLPVPARKEFLTKLGITKLADVTEWGPRAATQALERLQATLASGPK